MIQAYFINHTKPNESISKAITGLIRLQQIDGCFMDNNKDKSPFYTALVIITLCSSMASYKKYQTELKLAIQWLLSQQKADGSFLPTYSLQIPEASVLDPKKVKIWSKKENQATNTIAKDFMRLFTTSSCIKALNLYIKNESK